MCRQATRRLPAHHVRQIPKAIRSGLDGKNRGRLSVKASVLIASFLARDRIPGGRKNSSKASNARTHPAADIS